jgi:hypothetical protein
MGLEAKCVNLLNNLQETFVFFFSFAVFYQFPSELERGVAKHSFPAAATAAEDAYPSESRSPYVHNGGKSPGVHESGRNRSQSLEGRKDGKKRKNEILSFFLSFFFSLGMIDR